MACGVPDIQKMGEMIAPRGTPSVIFIHPVLNVYTTIVKQKTHTLTLTHTSVAHSHSILHDLHKMDIFEIECRNDTITK